MLKRNEQGNLYLWYAVALALMMGIFGLAVDFSFNTYARNTLQNSLDSAVVAAASETKTAENGRINIDKNRALNTIETLYDQNRENVPDAVCSRQVSYDNIDDLKGGETRAGAQSCWIISDFRINNNAGTMTISVREYKPNYFLKMIGLPYQEIQLTSTARLTSNLENA